MTITDEAIVAAAIAPHSTPTDDGPWDAGANVKNLSNDDGEKEYREEYAWVDPEGDPDTKTAYKYPHHFVSSIGHIGAASTVACSTGIGVLNGGMGGSKIPQADREGVYKHLVGHLKDAGVADKDLPVLASMADYEIALEAVEMAGGVGAPADNLMPDKVKAKIKAKQTKADDSENGTPRNNRTGSDAAEGESFAAKADAEPEDGDGGTGAPALESAWHAVLITEGLRTTDGRSIAPGALTWRTLPVPLAAAFSNEGGHLGAVPVGKIDTITRDGNKIVATGTWDLGSPQGQEAARSCAEQIMRFLSIDLEVMDSAYFDIDGDGDKGGYTEVLAGRIGMATQVMFPAFPGAVISPASKPLPDAPPLGEVTPVPTTPMIAALGDSDANLVNPPSAWFQDQHLDRLTHWGITEEGQVYGHLAGWSIAHRGIDGRKVFAPRSRSGYANFATGTVVCDDGTKVATGPITMGVGHADGRASMRAATAHYDDVNYGIADVAVGEDEFGIWMAGAIRPGVTPEQVRVALASDVSGDWRPTANGHELVAALVVNVAGFLIPNSLVASLAYTSVAHATFAQFQHGEEAGTLLAAGAVKRPDPIAELRREIAVLRAVVQPLLPLAAAALDDRMDQAQ